MGEGRRAEHGPPNTVQRGKMQESGENYTSGYKMNFYGGPARPSALIALAPALSTQPRRPRLLAPLLTKFYEAR